MHLPHASKIRRNYYLDADFDHMKLHLPITSQWICVIRVRVQLGARLRLKSCIRILQQGQADHSLTSVPSLQNVTHFRGSHGRRHARQLIQLFQLIQLALKVLQFACIPGRASES